MCVGWVCPPRGHEPGWWVGRHQARALQVGCGVLPVASSGSTPWLWGLPSRVKWAPGPCPYGISPYRPPPAKGPVVSLVRLGPSGSDSRPQLTPSRKLSGETGPGARPVTGWRSTAKEGGGSRALWPLWGHLGRGVSFLRLPALGLAEVRLCPGDDPGPLMGQMGMPAPGAALHGSSVHTPRHGWGTPTGRHFLAMLSGQQGRQGLRWEGGGHVWAVRVTRPWRPRAAAPRIPSWTPDSPVHPLPTVAPTLPSA